MRILISLVLLVLSIGLSAQSKVSAEDRTAAYTATFQLDQQQQSEMLLLQQRYDRNVKQLRKLRRKDRQRYLLKRRGLRQSLEANITNLLDQADRTAYQQQLRQEQVRRAADLVQHYKDAGKTQADIDQALLELEDLPYMFTGSGL